MPLLATFAADAATTTECACLCNANSFAARIRCVKRRWRVGRLAAATTDPRQRRQRRFDDDDTLRL